MARVIAKAVENVHAGGGPFAAAIVKDGAIVALEVRTLVVVVSLHTAGRQQCRGGGAAGVVCLLRRVWRWRRH